MYLTLPQQDLYYEQMLHPNTSILNIGANIRVKGKIDVDILYKSYRMMTMQNDASRSVLSVENDISTISFIDNLDVHFEFIDCSKYLEDDSKILEYMKVLFEQPFDLTDNKLLHRMYLLKIDTDLHYILFVCHHIISDGWGTSLLYQSFVDNYNQLIQGRKVLSDVVFSYEDFIEDDKIYKISKYYESDKAYWIDRFSALPDGLFEKINSFERTESINKTIILKRGLYDQLIYLAKKMNVTTFHLFLGLLFVYFGRRNRNKDFTIAIPILNRTKASYKKTAGMFMGVNLLRMKLNVEDTFACLVNSIKDQLKQDYRHQRFPLGKLINELGVFERERLYNLSFSYEKHNYSISLLGTQTEVIPLSHNSERVALAIYVREFSEKDDIKIDFNFHVNYFEKNEITGILEQFMLLIKDILNNPQASLNNLQYIALEDRNKILKEFNNTYVCFTCDKTIIDYIGYHNKIAVRDDVKCYTYEDIHRLSKQVAQYITENFGKSNKPINVLLRRNADLIIILLGIFRAGRAYIPIDPSFPEERMKSIIDDSKADFVITDKNVFVSECECPIAIVNDIFDYKVNSEFVEKKIDLMSIAYIIYTSGSTGKPKGVEITHQSLLNFLLSMAKKPGIKAEDILFSVTTYSFDISILEFFLPLISGASLYIANQHVVAEPRLTVEKIKKIRPSIIQATPSFFQMLYNVGWSGDKKIKVLCGGDLLSKALAQKLIDSSRKVWNMYGPTETTIWSSIKEIVCAEDANNIGRPIDNTQIYILDDDLNLISFGEVGNIYIGGKGVAKGYYQNEKLSVEKFIPNPFLEGERIYDTGDLGRWTKNGEIIFHGRRDSQAKVRGYRIELEEIETYLNRYLNIDNSVVLVKKDKNHEDLLVAYIPLPQKELNIEEIRAFLKDYLPLYMIPNRFVAIDSLPYTPNNKVDRKALALLDFKDIFFNEKSQKCFTFTEYRLSELWFVILDIPKTSIHSDANFFTLGGHSLSAIRMCSMIQAEFSVTLSMNDIFQYPTLKLLAEKLDKSEAYILKDIKKSNTKDYYDLAPSQLSLWLACQNKYLLSAYNMFGSYSVKGLVNIDILKKEIDGMIAKYETLRTNILEINGSPRQIINAKKEIHIDIIDGNHFSDNEKRLLLEEYSGYEFDLETDLLLKVAILRKDNDSDCLLFLTHHLIMDGWAVELFLAELSKAYSQKMEENEILDIQFKDYSEWLNCRIVENSEKTELFWKDYLLHYKKDELLCEEKNISNTNSKGKRVHYDLSTTQVKMMKDICKDSGFTLFGMLFASFSILLSKYSGSSDICLGTVFSGRDNNLSLMNYLGMFAKTLPVRVQIDDKLRYIDFLKQVNLTLTAVYKHQDLPSQYSLGKLFDILLVYQNQSYSANREVKLGDLELKMEYIDNIQARLPMVLNIYEYDENLDCEIDYDTSIYSHDAINELWDRFLVLIDQIISNTEEQVGNYNILVESEKEQMNSFDFDFNF